MHVQREHELPGRNPCPQAHVHGSRPHHPSQVHVQAFAGASRRRTRKVFSQARGRVRVRGEHRVAEPLYGGADMLRRRREVPRKEFLHRVVSAQHEAEVAREPEKVLRLKCPMPKSAEAPRVPICVERPNERIGPKTHPLAKVRHLFKDGFPATPGKQRGVHPDHFPVSGIVEPVGDGNGVLVDKGGLLEMPNEPLKAGPLRLPCPVRCRSHVDCVYRPRLSFLPSIHGLKARPDCGCGPSPPLSPYEEAEWGRMRQ